MPENKMPGDKMHDNPYPNPYAWPRPTVTGPLPFLPLYTHPLSMSLSLYIKTPFVSLYTDTLYLVSLYTLSRCLTTHSLYLSFSLHTQTLSLSLLLSEQTPSISLSLSLSHTHTHTHTHSFSIYIFTVAISPHVLYIIYSLYTHTHTLAHSLSLFLSTHTHSLSLYIQTLSISLHTHFLFLSLFHTLFISVSL